MISQGERAWERPWALSGATVLFWFLMLPVFALARDKTDIVELKNGNILSGEILSMSKAYLSVSTDSMGTLDIKWPDVVRIVSKHGYVVEDAAGRRFYGPLNTGQDQTLQITGIVGTNSVPLSSVISIYPSSRSLWKRFDGSLDVGYSFTKSESRSQFNLDGELRYRSIRWETQVNVESQISTSDGESETDRDTLGLNAMRHLGSRWHAFMLAQYQHNLELGLSYRNSILGGVARRLIQTNRTVFSVMAGTAYAFENYTDTQPNSNIEAGLGTQYQFYKLYSPKIDISIYFLVSPSLSTSGRVRSELQLKSKIEMIKDFFWSISFFDSYDSKPPGEQNQKQDYGVTTGVGWTFG